jgi:hypothetical protein
MADELATRLEKTLPPGLKEQKGKQDIPPEAKQALEQMGQQMDALTQELHANMDAMELKDQEIAAEKLKAQQAQSKTLSLQIQLERDAALKQIEEAQEQGEEQAEEIDQLELAKQSALDARERYKIEMQTDAELEKARIASATQIEIARINHVPSTPEASEAGNQTLEIMTQLLASHGALLEHVSKPKSAQLRILKQPDGSFIGEKVEN